MAAGGCQWFTQHRAAVVGGLAPWLPRFGAIMPSQALLREVTFLEPPLSLRASPAARPHSRAPVVPQDSPGGTRGDMAAAAAQAAPPSRRRNPFWDALSFLFVFVIVIRLREEKLPQVNGASRHPPARFSGPAQAKFRTNNHDGPPAVSSLLPTAQASARLPTPSPRQGPSCTCTRSRSPVRWPRTAGRRRRLALGLITSRPPRQTASVARLSRTRALADPSSRRVGTPQARARSAARRSLSRSRRTDALLSHL